MATKPPSVLSTAINATTPHLEKMAKTQSTMVTQTVEMGKAFGAAIAALHNEPLKHDVFVRTYGPTLRSHMEKYLGEVSDQTLLVVLRAANLAAAGQPIPNRATVLKHGKDKPMGDTAYAAVLVAAQRTAKLSTTKAGNGGDNRSPAKKKAAAKKKLATATKVAAAAGVETTSPAPTGVSILSPVAPKGQAAPAVAPTIDVAKAMEDAAAMLMGNANHADLLLKAIKTKKMALITWLVAHTKP